jgi:heptosyltransferase-2
MQDARHKILVWLPSPMGDAILSMPALRAIRQHFTSSQISFLARPAIRKVLSPSGFNDAWLEQTSKGPFKIAKMLQPHNFTIAILLKNSFASALAVFLAKIPSRIGYVREGRSLFLTDKLHPPRLPSRRFKPISMIDYYLAVPSWLGADTTNRSLELSVDLQDEQQARAKLPEVFSCKGPIVVLVPGGAFGPSKCWPSDRFAQIADWLIEKYNATVVISVASDPREKQIAGEICDSSKHKLISLAQTPTSLGQLKALFARADLALSNDTGPRHMAIALRRKVITLFGPNDPAWTDTSYENEIQILGQAPCAPCAKPVCKESEHLCMQAITVEIVCDAARRLLENQQTERFIRTGSGLAQISESLCVATDYEAAFRELGLTSIDSPKYEQE